MSENTKPKSFFKKNLKQIIILIISLLIFIFLIFFLFFNKNKVDSNGNKINSLPSFNFSFSDLFKPNNNSDIDNNNNSSTTATSSEQYISTNYYFEGLIKVWDDPVAGYNYYTKPYQYTYQDENGEEKTTTLTKTILQFVDSKTGYIYEKDLSDPTSTPSQVSKQSYPDIVRAYFLNDKAGGKGRVFLQYIDGEIIKTVSATIPDYYNSPANLLNIVQLPNNIKNIAVSNDNTKLAYVVVKNKNTNGFNDVSSDWYYIDNLDNLYGKKIYSSEFTYWKLIPLNNGEIYAFTTDTYSQNNTLYKVNYSNSSLSTLTIVYGDHNGMNFLINQDNLLVSIATVNGTKLYQTNFPKETLVDTDLSNLSFQTLANKCNQNDTGGENLIICSVPKEISNYEYGLPDAWYQGMTTFDDNLYVVNNNYINGQLLYDFKNDGGLSENIDGKDLKINNQKTHLTFINKNDSSLWTLNIQNILYSGSGD